MADKPFVLMGEGVSFGPITLRLAQTPEEIAAAQRLRYRVFYEEYGAAPSPEVAAQKRDFDVYDDVADHLIVIDTEKDAIDDRVVGTYRLIRESAAQKVGHFYSSGEFSIDKMMEAGKGTLLELGRSCIHADYRTRNVLQLLWQGIAEYIGWHGILYMFGCASFHGTDPDAIAESLTYLYHHHRAPDSYCPVARMNDPRRVEMNRIPVEQVRAKDVLVDLPPLIKGYLRIGAFVGDGAIIDLEFNTIDVCIIVETARLPERYREHYDRKTGTNFMAETAVQVVAG